MGGEDYVLDDEQNQMRLIASHYNNMQENASWNCYNCGENRNSIITNSCCKSCDFGINPFHYFILNKRDPYKYYDKYPILKKKFGLMKGRIENCDGDQSRVQNVCVV